MRGQSNRSARTSRSSSQATRYSAGGVGTFAVQIAKSFGAEVTGVCSTRNVDMVRSIGADRVIDYTREDFTKNGQRYDVILDNVGNHSLSECRRALNPKGKYVIVGGPAGRWIDPLPRAFSAVVLSWFVSQDLSMFLAELNKKDLTILGDLMQAGKVTPVVGQALQIERGPGGDPVSRRRARSRKNRHHLGMTL